MKVKIIGDYEYAELENKINSFIENVDVIQVSFSSDSTNSSDYYVALILFRENNMRKNG